MATRDEETMIVNDNVVVSAMIIMRPIIRDNWLKTCNYILNFQNMK